MRSEASCRMKSFITNRKLISAGAVISLMLIWHGAAFFLAKPLILPSPQAALANLILLIGAGDFWRHVAATLSRGLFAFGLSFGIAIALGLPAGKFQGVEALLRPVMVCLRSTPSMSFILLALLWFRGSNVPIFVIILVVLPLLFQNVIEGIRSIDLELLEMATLYRVKKSRLLLKFYLPSVTPFLAAGVQSGLGLTWKVAIAAEVLAYPTWGIGTQMDNARVYLQTETVFAWTVAVIGIGLLFDYLTDYLLRRPFTAWKEAEHV
jgi:NitT/TauT family transport system permease protein